MYMYTYKLVRPPDDRDVATLTQSPINLCWFIPPFTEWLVSPGQGAHDFSPEGEDGIDLPVTNLIHCL